MNIPDHLNEGIIFGVWGQEKTYKTTLALTSPTPMAYFEFDLGGLNRAKGRPEIRKIVGDASLFRYHQYVLPMQTHPIKILGAVQPWYQFVSDFVSALGDEKIKTLVVDTSTQAWQFCRKAFLQEWQEQRDKAGQSIPESLPQQMYTEPNDRFRALLYAPRTRGKNLVVVHYETDEYTRRPNAKTGILEDVPTGRVKFDGFAKTPNAADVLVRTTRGVNPKDKQPFAAAEITLCGLTTKAEGMSIDDPSWDKIMGMIARIRGE